MAVPSFISNKSSQNSYARKKRCCEVRQSETGTEICLEAGKMNFFFRLIKFLSRIVSGQIFQRDAGNILYSI